jgi:hypothetical protein
MTVKAPCKTRTRLFANYAIRVMKKEKEGGNMA